MEHSTLFSAWWLYIEIFLWKALILLVGIALLSPYAEHTFSHQCNSWPGHWETFVVSIVGHGLEPEMKFNTNGMCSLVLKTAEHLGNTNRKKPIKNKNKNTIRVKTEINLLHNAPLFWVYITKYAFTIDLYNGLHHKADSNPFKPNSIYKSTTSYHYHTQIHYIFVSCWLYDTTAPTKRRTICRLSCFRSLHLRCITLIDYMCIHVCIQSFIGHILYCTYMFIWFWNCIYCCDKCGVSCMRSLCSRENYGYTK